jgi:DNA-binding FadR family transcriptional regulator
MALGSLRPSPLVEQAAERLRQQITGGQWPVGTKLPGETTLAASLGVGRSTVREALRALAGAGMVRTRQGAGVFVIATRPVEDWPTRLRRGALVDVYEVRAMLEVQAARLAAARRTPEDVTALRTALAARTTASANAASAQSAGEGSATGSARAGGATGAGATPRAGGAADTEEATHTGPGATEPFGPPGGLPGAVLLEPLSPAERSGDEVDTRGNGASDRAGAAFVDADIALHSAVVAAAHNPVLSDLFAEFAPVLRENLLALLDLVDVHAHDEEHGGAAHAELVEAIAAGEPDRAARVLHDELTTTQAHLRDRNRRDEEAS